MRAQHAFLRARMLQFTASFTACAQVSTNTHLWRCHRITIPYIYVSTSTVLHLLQRAHHRIIAPQSVRRLSVFDNTRRSCDNPFLTLCAPHWRGVLARCIFARTRAQRRAPVRLIRRVGVENIIGHTAAALPPAVDLLFGCEAVKLCTAHAISILSSFTRAHTHTPSPSQLCAHAVFMRKLHGPCVCV